MLQNRIARGGGLLLAAALAGCGGSALSTANPGTPPPHGGDLIQLPGGGGYVEVVVKPGGTHEASFYVLKDPSTPYSPAPTAGSLAVGKNKKVALQAEGGALVTPPGPPLFKGTEPDGVLTIDLDGKTRTIPLGVR